MGSDREPGHRDGEPAPGSDWTSRAHFTPPLPGPEFWENQVGASGTLVYLSEKWVDNSPTWMLAQASGRQACEWKGSSGGHGLQAGAGGAAWILGEGQTQLLGPKCFSVPEALGCTSRGAWDDRITLCDDHGLAEWFVGQQMAAGPMAFMQPRSERLVQSQEEEWVR